MISSGYIRKMGPKGLTDKLKTWHVRIPAFSCLGACDALSPPPEAFFRWCSARGWLLLTPTGSQRSFPATHFPLTLLTGPCHFPRGTFHGRNGRGSRLLPTGVSSPTLVPRRSGGQGRRLSSSLLRPSRNRAPWVLGKQTTHSYSSLTDSTFANSTC